MSSRTRVVGFRAVLPASILLLTGCSEPVGPHIPGIEVTLSLSQEEISVGETIEIRVLATNTTANPVSFTTDGCVFHIRFLDQSNTQLGALPFLCNSIALGHTLAPGESLTKVTQFDGTVSRLTGELFTLESGTYGVFAGILAELLNPSDAVELRIQP